MSDFYLERKKYTVDSPPEIVELLKARVSVIGDNIIVLDEIPLISSFSIDIVFTEMKKYATEFDKCAYLVNLTDTALPDSEVRRHINSKFIDILSNVKHISFVTGRNFILNTVVKFVMFQTKLDSFTICKTVDEGVSKIKEVLRSSTREALTQNSSNYDG